MKKKFILTAAIAASLCMLAPLSAQAAPAAPEGAWKSNDIGWWYECTDKTYLTSGFYDITDQKGEVATYYFDGTGYMATGWKTIDGKKYYFEQSGAMVTGWQTIGGKEYYFHDDGSMATDYVYAYKEEACRQDYFYFNTDGTLKKNQWVSYGDKWYYVDENGATKHGWLQYQKKWYYLGGQYGEMLTNQRVWDKDKIYIVDKNGVMVSGGWYLLDDNWYYAETSGALHTGWLKLGSSWYYFDEWGNMYRSWGANAEYTIGGKKYLFQQSGKMVAGWYNYADKYSTYGDWAYCNSDGSVYDGWISSSGKWYYINNGDMLNNQWIYLLKREDGSKYYSTSRNDTVVTSYFLGKDGVMVKGWYKSAYSSETYSSYSWMYTNPSDGTRFSGWVKSSGKWYYISESYMVNSGVRAATEDESPNRDDYNSWDEYDAARKAWHAKYDYVFDGNGAMVTGWYGCKDTYGTTWYYATSEGKAYDGWLKYNGNWYYIEQGEMLTNAYVEGGYFVGADGICK